MNDAYGKRFEAVYLCTHPKESKMSISAAAKYKKSDICEKVGKAQQKKL